MKYKDAGVNLEAARGVVKIIGKKAKTTLSSDVLGGVGPFGAMYRVSQKGLSNPVLVATMDGVGTKLKVCAAMGRHEDAGYDIVSHCANDCLSQGAAPLFVLDYIAMSVLDLKVIGNIVDGMVKACEECGCSLVGGETAELPDTYGEDEYEVVACMVGVVDMEQIVDGRSITGGDVLIGLASTGLHTNGFSLARKVLLDLRGFLLGDRLPELGTTVGEALLAPHRQYVRSVLPLVKKGLVKGIAHITGGGLPGNICRILPKGLGVTVRRGSWEVLPIFHVIQREGRVEEDEMYQVFNMGLGMVLVVQRSKSEEAIEHLVGAGEKIWIVGEVVESQKAFELT